jgi:dTDP-glucose 4,6-dehydratase
MKEPLHVWENNTKLIGNILEFVRGRDIEMFIQCSTDEVFGPAPDGHYHTEWETAIPSNPYSASKAAQEALCISYWRTYGVPIVITNTMNMIGERQEVSKYLPKIIRAIYRGEEIVVHGTPDRIGSRMYLDAKNLADAWLFLMENLSPRVYQDGPDAQRPSRYNVVGQEEVSNLELARRVAEIMGKTANYRFEDFHSVRPGHDRRYALDGTALRDFGWKHPFPLGETLRRIVKWTIENPNWLL